MKLTSIYNLFDKILLLKINKTVKYLYSKSFLNKSVQGKNSNYSCNLTTIKSKDIPFEYNEYSVKNDTVILESVINEKEKSLGSEEWSTIHIYQCILKAFRKEYFKLVMLMLILQLFDGFVKYRGIIYFRMLIGDSIDGKSLKAIVPGLLMFVFKVTLLLSETHLKYYILRLGARVTGSINGISLSRLSKCDISPDEHLNENLSPKSKISRYQNIITVDSESSENAVSYSIRVLIFPLRLISSLTVASITFDPQALKLLVILLSILFLLAVISLFISTLFKRPFIAYREKRLAETANIIENSRCLILTQDHVLASFHDLLSESRKNEMYYGSFRKYFFTLEEILSRSMSYICYGMVSLYVWYNHIDVTESVKMIIDAAWLVPSFYTPLQELCYLIYYISEGFNALNRLSKLMQLTRSIRPNRNVVSDGNDCNNSITVGVNHSIVIEVDRFWNKNIFPETITLKYGMPMILLSDNTSNDQFLRDILRFIIFGTNTGVGINIKLVGEKNSVIGGMLNCINNPICYAPSEAWISDGMSLSDIILSGREYNAEDWDRVIDICELKKDFLILGITDYELARSTIFSQVQFSKGQKTRLSLARALYGIGHNKKSDKDLRDVSILILDSIFVNLDPIMCSSILSKLFNNVNGLLMNSFSIVILDINMLGLLPHNIAESFVHIATSKKKLADSFKFQNTQKSTFNNVPSIINSIITNNCYKNDLYEGVWKKLYGGSEINSNNFDNCKYEIGTNNDLNKKPMTPIITKNLNINTEIIEENKKKKVYIENDSELHADILQSTEIREEDTYTTYLYYILKAANRYKYPTNWDGFTKIRESSKEMIFYLLLLILPQLILVFGEKVLLSSLDPKKAISGVDLNVDFWYFTYFLCIIMAISSVITSGYLEVLIGLRAAKNIHNSFLLGYISSKLSSCIRSLPVSFVLNRLSLDQLTIDYCTTKRLGQFTTAINRIMGFIYLSVVASEQPLLHISLFLLFGIFLYEFVLRYFIHSCRLLHNTYISEISPLVDIARNICDGKDYLYLQKLDNFYLENGYKQLQKIMKPIYIRSSLETWLKLRLQVGIIVPVTFLNMVSSYISGTNSKVLIALVVATAYSSLPRIDEIVRYWMRLERELVSVERMRKYIQIMKEDHFSYRDPIKNEDSTSPGNSKSPISNNLNVISQSKNSCFGRSTLTNTNTANIILESVYGYHLAIFSEHGKSQLDRSEIKGTLIKKTCCLKNITLEAKKGDVIGIIGRSGSGKTSLLCLIAKSLYHKGNIKHLFPKIENDDSIKHIIGCNLCKSNTDQQIMSMFISDYNRMKHIAMLPIEVFFNENTTIRRSVDPFDRYTDENIISALNICGISDFIIEKEINYQLASQLHKNGDTKLIENLPLLNENNRLKYLISSLNRKINDLSLPMHIQRILLFTHFFLKRAEIHILLIDEPPIICCEQKNLDTGSNINYLEDSSLISNIAFKYFNHSITFIVAHDIRNLSGIRKFWYLHQGSVITEQI